jgi:tripartite-type tricarboxylate transporter receptor subunit TctC
MAVIITNPPGSGGEGGASTWDELTGKPATFTPSTHSHPISEVTSLQTTLDAKATTSDIDDAVDDLEILFGGL